jgi:hypothetical protein
MVWKSPWQKGAPTLREVRCSSKRGRDGPYRKVQHIAQKVGAKLRQEGITQKNAE